MKIGYYDSWTEHPWFVQVIGYAIVLCLGTLLSIVIVGAVIRTIPPVKVEITGGCK